MAERKPAPVIPLGRALARNVRIVESTERTTVERLVKFLEDQARRYEQAGGIREASALRFVAKCARLGEWK